MIKVILYHWSPSYNRDSIFKDGLKVATKPTINTKSQSCISCSLDPKTAWKLSADLTEIASWDLYQITLSSMDEVHIQPCWSGNIQEVRVKNSVAPHQLFFVGTKERCDQSPLVDL
ncbi:MAG: hypothetical protein WBB28_09500 [Crinalium sp.]